MKMIFLAVSVLCLAESAASESLACGSWPCEQTYTLESVSAAKSYGLLLQAPNGDCRRMRYSVRSESAVFLGHTRPLGPGEVAIVRIGRGFSEGGHALTIDAEGCVGWSVKTRRVTLAKPSPDHGWLASD